MSSRQERFNQAKRNISEEDFETEKVTIEEEKKETKEEEDKRKDEEFEQFLQEMDENTAELIEKTKKINEEREAKEEKMYLEKCRLQEEYNKGAGLRTLQAIGITILGYGLLDSIFPKNKGDD